jgi:polyhydroxybutyrate depolymerase
MSNGAFMSHRLGCEMSDTLAAIGPVIAAMPSAEGARCAPAMPIAVIAMQGTSDPAIPYAGGEQGGNGRRKFGEGGLIDSADKTRIDWARRNGCSESPREEKMTSSVSDGTSVDKISYSGCRADVVFYRINGMGHRWPGPMSRRTPLVDRIFGKQSQNIDATKTIWEFFKAHPKK